MQAAALEVVAGAGYAEYVTRSAVSRDEAERHAKAFLDVLSRRLRAWREAKGLSQMEVAYNADVSVDSIRSYEAARRVPPITVVDKIALVLGISLEDLMFRDPPTAEVRRIRK